MKINLAVFFGGKSVEHEVSIITAIQAMNNIDKKKYEIIPIYISKENDMYMGEDIGNIDSYKDIPNLLRRSFRVILVKEGNKTLIVKYPLKKFGNNTISHIDIAFPMGHGTNVEDGTLQGFLQTLGLPYVGCDILGAAVGMNKYIVKAILTHAGIPVLEGKRIRIEEYSLKQTFLISEIEKKYDYPVIIKPNNLGSSVGIKIGTDTESLNSALEHAFLFSNEVICEKAIVNLKEVNVSVLGDPHEAVASECEEPINNDKILSYEDKYITSGTKDGMASLSRKIPAEISTSQRETIRSLAVKAFRELGCSGVSRIDFLIDMDNQNIYLNEINTLPGSLAFYLWEPVGIKYPELLEKMINLALKRERENKNINFSFESNILKDVKFGGKKGKKV